MTAAPPSLSCLQDAASSSPLLLPGRLALFSPPACGRGWGRAPRRRRPGPGRTAAGPLPASPASGGGESRAAAPASLSCLQDAASSSPLLLPGRLPFSPPACGRGWGRAPRRRRPGPGRTAAGPLPASPASGGGEEARRLHHPFPACRTPPPLLPSCCRDACPSPLPLAGGVGGGPLGATGLGRAAPPLAPSRPPPQAEGEWGNRGGGSIFRPSRLQDACPSSPLPLAGGVGGGSLGAAGLAGPHRR